MTQAFIYTYDKSPKPKPWLPEFVRKSVRSTLPKQKAACRALAAKKQFRVVGQYGAEYESFNRPHRSQMLRELKRSPGRVEAVIVYSCKNLEPGLREFIRLLDQIEAAGAKVYVAHALGNLHPEILKRINQ